MFLLYLGNRNVQVGSRSIAIRGWDCYAYGIKRKRENENKAGGESKYKGTGNSDPIWKNDGGGAAAGAHDPICGEGS